MENYGKTAVFPGGYGRIGEIPHGRLWPDREYVINKMMHEPNKAFQIMGGL